MGSGKDSAAQDESGAPAWPFGDHPDDDDDRPEGDYGSELSEAPAPIRSSDGKAAGRATFIR